MATMVESNTSIDGPPIASPIAALMAAERMPIDSETRARHASRV